LYGYFEWKSDCSPTEKHDFPHLLANGVVIHSLYDGEALAVDKGYVGET
jgi:hypothetical protein